MKAQKLIRTTASLVLTTGLVFCASSAAIADDRAAHGGDDALGVPQVFSGETLSYETTALELKGFDATIAEANGYQIITNADGTQNSIPVSAEAIQFELSRTAELENTGDGAVANRTTVTGNCGTSFVGVTRYGNRIMVGTGYSVFYPVVARLWILQIYSFEGIPSFTWTGSTGASWNSAASFFMTAGGVASVTPGSSVVMQNGAICWSGSPSEGF